MTLDLPVLDPHVHFWDPRTTPRAVTMVGRLFFWQPRLMRHVGPRLFPRAARDFVGKPDYLMHAWLPGQLAAEHAGYDVRGVVHVQAGWEDHAPLAPVDETRWVNALDGGSILGLVGEARLDGAELDTLITAHRAASSRLVGLRDMLANDPDPGVMDFSDSGRSRTAAFRRGLARVGEAGLTFDAWCYGPQLPELSETLAEAPRTPTVLCHFGTPIGAGGPFAGHGTTAAARANLFARWKDDYARVAALPHVQAKLSGLGMPALGFGFHTRPTPPSAAELADAYGPFVEHALQVFGPARCFFASNFPTDRVTAPFGVILEAYSSLVAGYDLETRRGLFHDNAVRFYGLGSRS